MQKTMIICSSHAHNQHRFGVSSWAKPNAMEEFYHDRTPSFGLNRITRRAPGLKKTSSSLLSQPLCIICGRKYTRDGTSNWEKTPQLWLKTFWKSSVTYYFPCSLGSQPYLGNQTPCIWFGGVSSLPHNPYHPSLGYLSTCYWFGGVCSHPHIPHHIPLDRTKFDWTRENGKNLSRGNLTRPISVWVLELRSVTIHTVGRSEVLWCVDCCLLLTNHFGFTFVLFMVLIRDSIHAFGRLHPVSVDWSATLRLLFTSCWRRCSHNRGILILQNFTEIPKSLAFQTLSWHALINNLLCTVFPFFINEVYRVGRKLVSFDFNTFWQKRL